MNTTNKVIQWLIEQNEINNHLFKTNKDFNDYLIEDICTETIDELQRQFMDISVVFIKELISELITKHSNNETNRNSYVGHSISVLTSTITLTYSLHSHQSYSKHESIAKGKLKKIIQANNIYTSQIWFKHVIRAGNTNKYIFTYDR